MARLTWQNVSAPDFSGSLQGLAQFGTMLDRGLSRAKEGINEFDAVKDEATSNELARRVAMTTDPAVLQKSLQDGSLFAGLNMDRLNKADLMGSAAYADDLLARATNTENLDWSKFTHERDKGTFAAQDAARGPALQIQALMMQDKPKEAAALMEANRGVLGDLRLSDINALVNQFQGVEENTVGLAGNRISNQQAAWNYSTGVEDRAMNEAASALASSVTESAIDAESARTALFASPGWKNANGRVKQAALGMIDARFGNIMQDSSGSFGGGLGGDGGAGGGAGVAATDVTSLVAGFEGFRETPYWDVNHHRVGYGSDTVTRADGTVVKTTPGMKISRADADRDLQRRLGELDSTLGGKIGQSWGSLPEGTRAAITSVAYNYGDGSKRLAPLYAAARSGDVNKVASIIEGLAGDNNGVNANRRRQEAAVARGGFDPIAAGAAANNQVKDINTADNADAVIAAGANNASIASLVNTALGKGGIFEGMGVDKPTLMRSVANVVRSSMVNGVPKINNAQALEILANNRTKRGTTSVGGFWGALGVSREDPTKLAWDEQGIKSAIDKAKRGGYEDSDVARQTVAATQAQVNQARAAVQRAEARYQAVARRVASQPNAAAALRPYTAQVLAARQALAAAEAEHGLGVGAVRQQGVRRPTERPGAMDRTPPPAKADTWGNWLSQKWDEAFSVRRVK